MYEAENTILFGKYQMCRVIGSGQSGTVYQARHVMLDQYRAIKQIPAKQAFQEDPEREVHILKNLRHPGIPIIYDVYRTEESFYLVEEYLEGESLFALVSRRGSLSKAETVSLGIQLCRIISYLHQSADNPILHLDLQPKNILLCQDVLKLIDFDQAVFMSAGHCPKRRFGTVGCAAPEQYGKEALTEQTDIYAIGALLFYMRKGIFPQTRADRGKEAGGLAAIIEKCLQKEPDKRYTNVRILLKDLISLKEDNFSNSRRSSLTIAFAGSKSGIGATHASLGLAVFLADQGIPVLYEETNGSGAVWRMADEAGEIPDSEGIIRVGPWRLFPPYGPAVHIEKEDPPSVRIRDYGNDPGRAAADPDADAFCLVCGGKAWEAAQSVEAAQVFPPGSRLIAILNHMDEGGAVCRLHGGSGRRLRALGEAADVFCLPFFPDPGKPGARARSFYRALYEEILKRKGEEPCVSRHGFLERIRRRLTGRGRG